MLVSDPINLPCLRLSKPFYTCVISVGFGVRSSVLDYRLKKPTPEDVAMRFDARQAKLLQAGEHLIVEGCQGLRLVATAARKTWTYRYKDAAGKMKQARIGHWPAMSPAEAITEWAALRGRRASGLPVVKKSAPVSDIYTVRKLVDDYLDGHIAHHRKPKGQAEVTRLLTGYVGEIELVEASALTRSMAFDLLEGLQGTPVLAGQIKQEMAGAWDYALDAGRIPQDTPNWWRLVMRGRLKSKGKKIAGEHIGAVKRVLTGEEVGELVRWLPNFSQALNDMLTLYLWTGCRGAELVQIEANEVSEETDGLWWTCPKVKTKNARHTNASDLRVPLVGRAADVVRRRLVVAKQMGHSHLFPSTGAKPKNPHLEQKAVQTAVWYHQPYGMTTRPDDPRPLLSVTHWSPHDLRRTVRTTLAALGCPDPVAEAVLGHMPPGIQWIYNRHSYDRERRDWMTKLAAHWEHCASV